jgi:hypothetical protein
MKVNKYWVIRSIKDGTYLKGSKLIADAHKATRYTKEQAKTLVQEENEEEYCTAKKEFILYTQIGKGTVRKTVCNFTDEELDYAYDNNTTIVKYYPYYEVVEMVEILMDSSEYRNYKINNILTDTNAD